MTLAVEHNVKQQIKLNIRQYLTASQWSFFSMGVTWAYFLWFVTVWPRVFWILWNLCWLKHDKPQRVTVIETTTNQSICSNDCHFWSKILSYSTKVTHLKKHALQVLLTCSEKENSASNHTPRFLTESTGWRRLPRILIRKWEEIFSRWALEPKTINSVFSGLSFSLLSDIYRCTSWRQAISLVRAAEAFLWERWMYSWVLSS